MNRSSLTRMAGANITDSKNGGEEHFAVGEKALNCQTIVRIFTKEVTHSGVAETD